MDWESAALATCMYICLARVSVFAMIANSEVAKERNVLAPLEFYTRLYLRVYCIPTRQMVYGRGKARREDHV